MITYLFFIIKVCVTGIVIWSFIPSSFVRATDTLPSSGLGNINDMNGFIVRLPAIMPKLKVDELERANSCRRITQQESETSIETKENAQRNKAIFFIPR